MGGPLTLAIWTLKSHILTQIEGAMAVGCSACSLGAQFLLSIMSQNPRCRDWNHARHENYPEAGYCINGMRINRKSRRHYKIDPTHEKCHVAVGAKHLLPIGDTLLENGIAVRRAEAEIPTMLAWSLIAHTKTAERNNWKGKNYEPLRGDVSAIQAEVSLPVEHRADAVERECHIV